jgi:hypothetical protein
MPGDVTTIILGLLILWAIDPPEKNINGLKVFPRGGF